MTAGISFDEYWTAVFHLIGRVQPAAPAALTRVPLAAGIWQRSDGGHQLQYWWDGQPWGFDLTSQDRDALRTIHQWARGLGAAVFPGEDKGPLRGQVISWRIIADNGHPAMIRINPVNILAEMWYQAGDLSDELLTQLENRHSPQYIEAYKMAVGPCSMVEEDIESFRAWTASQLGRRPQPRMGFGMVPYVPVPGAQAAYEAAAIVEPVGESPVPLVEPSSLSLVSD
jgi:hypothetical protein